MTLYRMYDAAYPPSSPFPGCQAVAGYIGGNTPNPWSNQDWQNVAHLVQFPIWVGYLDADPTHDAQMASQIMHNLGWNPGSPNRRAVILDKETQVDPAWVDTFASVIWAAGYQTFMYGSLATILRDPPKEGYLVADWTGVPALPPYANVIGCQYEANVPWLGTTVDLSVITAEMLSHGGTGARTLFGIGG